MPPPLPLPAPKATGALPVASRRNFVHATLAGAGLGLGSLLSGLAGCLPASQASRQPDLLWGRRGLSAGRLMKPRAMALDAEDQLHIVDITGRIQVFDPEGNYLRGWRTPEITQGKPTGLGFARDGTLLVADTHYFRVLFYSAQGELDTQRTIGGEHGDGPGQFHFVTDVAEDPRGHFFVGQYGQIDRIQEFDPAGKFIRAWGSQGSQPGQFSRPQALLFDSAGLLWIADACNHRIQVYDVQGANPQRVACWGTPGSEVGQLQYPYGLDFDRDGTLLVAEFGNHRIQRFSPQGEGLEAWGQVGSAAGLLHSPWALGLDSQRRLHVLDTMNHRVQRFPLA
ncbi:MAG: SMP-30/gluconolactonase/LRE family protein [Planctomycetales bacterium]|nr:SMP-30/gluconolactonase/LRE family protein [Planctomycetales bacterium]